MSAKLMGQVWELKLSANQQCVLLALADHARDDGSSVYPGVPYLAWKTGYSERNVQYILRELEGAQLITAVSNQQGGRGARCEYQINIENGVKKTPYHPPKGCSNFTEKKGANFAKGAKSDTERVQNPTEKGAKSAPTYIEEPSIEPSYSEPSVHTQRASARRVPENITLEIYNAYPKHVARPDALKAIERALLRISKGQDAPDAETQWPPPEPAQWLLERTRTFAESPKGQQGRFTPHPATWFNQARYSDSENEWTDEVTRHEQPQLSRRDATSLNTIRTVLGNRIRPGSSSAGNTDENVPGLLATAAGCRPVTATSGVMGGQTQQSRCVVGRGDEVIRHGIVLSRR